MTKEELRKELFNIRLQMQFEKDEDRLEELDKQAKAVLKQIAVIFADERAAEKEKGDESYGKHKGR